ncbi:tripartite motif-containing protein 75-like [Leptodactylus fuscus]|uniref:tripartite motif-containing protein 75-like n=1 Tax=Leptodactylus fuscus TaxID=238119 RepID=UPI003F4E46AB
MASAALGKELECSICLSLYTDPVTLRCGHNFCRVCIDQHLNTQEGSGAYSCPDCREEFQERPGLRRNITLCNVVENVQSTQPKQEEISGIRCTYCVDSPAPAVRSCLMCEASLCDQHLRVHSKGPKHVLTEPSTDLEKRKCPVHKKVLEYYCTEDSACICVSCSLAGEHRGHQVEMLDEASENKKKKLKDVLRKLTTKRKKTEARIQSLEWSQVQELRGKISPKGISSMFAGMRAQLDHLEKKILSEISRQKEQRSLSDVIHKLKIKKDELSRKMRHIEELCDLCDPEAGGGDEDMGGHYGSDQSSELIIGTLFTLYDVLYGVNFTFDIQGPADILLDVTTANNNLLISGDLKTATQTGIKQNRPQNAKRFLEYNQVMSRNSFSSGRHYWDVEVSGSWRWMVGMCYPSIDKSGRQSYIGGSEKSWGLWGGRIYDNRYFVRHNRDMTWLYNQVSSARVRIYVDYEAGQLSYYELRDPVRHLHTIINKFTEPLQAVLCVYNGHIKILGGKQRL